MAVRFDTATDRYIATTGVPATNVLTACWWAYVSVARGTYTCDLMICDASGVGTLWVLNNGGVDQFRCWNSTGSASLLLSLTRTVGAWYRVAAVVNGGTTTLYAGPEGGALSSTSGALTAGASPSRVYVGSDHFDEWFNGRIANFKLYDAVLTESEIEAELGQYAPVRTANLNRYYPFTTAPGTADASGNGRNLTAGSTATATEAGPDIPSGEVAAVPRRQLVRPSAAAMRAVW